jgi:cell fate regulator YaaT (PSP1 superfamily)
VSELIEIAFKGNRREFFHWDDVAPPPGAPAGVIVEGDRGEDLGRIHATGERAELRWRGVPHGAVLGLAPKRVLRLATRDDLRRAETLADENEQARRGAMQAVRTHALAMKITDADWQWDRRKLTLYFTAEKRVDFRALVRELASTFRTRIELKQIGVRDEARRLDGIGRCGRQYCSASWLPELRPVNLGVAKDQRLSLNPMQISGACGRLMCCLRYEHDFYVQSRRRFPKEGRILVTARGEEKVLSSDIFRDLVTLRGLDGEVRTVPLAELAAGTEFGTAPAEPEGPREGAVEGLAIEEAPRRLPVLPPAPTTPRTPPPAPPRAAVPAAPVPTVIARPAAPPPPILPAAAEASEDDEDGDDEGDDDAPPIIGADGTVTPRKRRRRGRRGGRRNRARQAGADGDIAGGEPPASAPSHDG